MTNSEIVRMWLDHDSPETIERLRTIMHPEHTFYSPLAPAPLSAEEHIGMLYKMQKIFSNQYHYIDLLLESGDYVTVRGRITGIHSQEFRGISPTNKQINVSFNLIMHIVDGKVKEEYMELNLVSIENQLRSS
jgi:predicted ester cyclase